MERIQLSGVQKHILWFQKSYRDLAELLMIPSAARTEDQSTEIDKIVTNISEQVTVVSPQGGLYVFLTNVYEQHLDCVSISQHPIIMAAEIGTDIHVWHIRGDQYAILSSFENKTIPFFLDEKAFALVAHIDHSEGMLVDGSGEGAFSRAWNEKEPTTQVEKVVKKFVLDRADELCASGPSSCDYSFTDPEYQLGNKVLMIGVLRTTNPLG